MRRQIHSVLSPVFLVLFVFIEYGFRSRIESTGPYTSYFIELALILVVAFGWKGFRYHKQNPKWMGLAFFMAFYFGGFLIRALCGPFNVGAPFDFSSAETVLFLIAFGPLLEEFVFRGVLIRLLRDLILSRYLIILISAVAFSYAHFQVLFETPVEFHPFIVYQTVYTFLLGLACGYVAVTYGLLWSVLAHFAFNLGFLLGG